MIQKSIAVPDEVDRLATRMKDSDPDMSYSMAIRKILRAGMESIMESERVYAGRTQIDPMLLDQRR